MRNRARVLTTNEIQRAMDYAESERRYGARDRLAIALTHFLGLRPKELSQLSIADVYTAAMKPKEVVTIAKRFSKNLRARDLPVNTRLCLELQWYASSLVEPAGSDPLLLSERRSFMDPASVQQALSRIYKLCGLDGASGYSGRRWYGTTQKDNGVSMPVIQRGLGHATLQHTASYLDVSDRERREAVEGLSF